MLEAMLSHEPSDPPAGTLPDPEVAPAPSALQRLGWAIRDLPSLMRTIPPAVTALRERVRIEKEFAARGQTDRPSAADRRERRPFGGRLSRGRRFACHTASLAEMREVRAALGGTINDVFIACAAAAARESLLARGLPCDSPIPATMPLTVTPAAERPRIGGNFLAADDVWLHVDIADPLERYEATRRSAKATKEHFDAIVDSSPFALVDLIPGAVISAWLHASERSDNPLMPVCDTVVSNIRGPDAPLYLGRWRLDRWYSIGQLWPGNGLNFTAWSYAGQFNVCVLADARRVPDAWELIAGFSAALQELVSLARDPARRDKKTTAGS
jgi:WS/DGAT/MGAT family acyltransferase